MPAMNGRQLAEQILKIPPHTKILYISGSSHNAIAHYGVLEEGIWFLPKPFTLSALVSTVREVPGLRRGRRERRMTRVSLH
jgi:two-component system, cell cycle sensor histidine kinase and response regulator CckA